MPIVVKTLEELCMPELKMIALAKIKLLPTESF